MPSVRDAFASDRPRPIYHYLPPKNWTNDPNGTFYADGKYHLFYQHRDTLSPIDRAAGAPSATPPPRTSSTGPITRWRWSATQKGPTPWTAGAAAPSNTTARPDSLGVRFFAQGPQARLDRLDAWQMGACQYTCYVK